ncbi:ABC transporter ATP-binding protein [Paenibacillus sp. UNC451MF]|uniref:ABC transporter ATP-binding protein n=1 Tax=Paenibacillus sp. UNC451MF TaxID=1449063 RepID=UPI00055D7ECB|nr:ABC transporter ATP-binding protein [Paenibacillus sp. UNC451MF]
MAGSTQHLDKQSIGVSTVRPKIEISQLSKIYKGRTGDVTALQNTDLTIGQNEFVCVVGPSGCGKTTLLNIIAGLEEATSGSVKVDGVEVKGPGKERGVVFQQYALFPWKTVLKNVEFGLKLRGLSKQERRETAEKYLEIVGLKDFAHAYPKELSGGMKQRVAIARAYAVQPEVLLMDEPFGALDAQTRAQLQEELLKTWQTEKKTCFFITHDVEEAVILAQKVIIMSARPGRIKEIIDVDIPYPRDQATKLDERFVQIKNEIWSKVYREYLEVAK